MRWVLRRIDAHRPEVTGGVEGDIPSIGSADPRKGLISRDDLQESVHSTYFSRGTETEGDARVLIVLLRPVMACKGRLYESGMSIPAFDPGLSKNPWLRERERERHNARDRPALSSYQPGFKRDLFIVASTNLVRYPRLI